MQQTAFSAEAFPAGKEDWTVAARTAARCAAFQPDVEEEQVAEETCSCYNCRYRRWTAVSFTCVVNGNG
jgi:hypothetical protein